MPIEYVKGDLIRSDCDVIGHGCNCFNNMGGGIALQVKKELVEAYNADFYGTEIGDRSKMGTFTKAKSNGKTVYNLYTQYKYGHDKVYVEYDHLETALKNLREDLGDKLHDVKIGLPLIGCGLARGSWRVVSKIVEKVFPDKTIHVYSLEK